MLPKTEQDKKDDETLKQNQIAYFDFALDENNQLMQEQKKFVRNNYDRLGKIVDKILDDKEKANLPVEQWVRESLPQSYTANFTETELNNLITLFQSAAGK